MEFGAWSQAGGGAERTRSTPTLACDQSQPAGAASATQGDQSHAGSNERRMNQARSILRTSTSEAAIATAMAATGASESGLNLATSSDLSEASITRDGSQFLTSAEAATNTAAGAPFRDDAGQTMPDTLQERIRKFSAETQACLQRDIQLERERREAERARMEERRRRIEQEWRRTKRELEHDDRKDEEQEIPIHISHVHTAPLPPGGVADNSEDDGQDNSNYSNNNSRPSLPRHRHALVTDVCTSPPDNYLSSSSSTSSPPTSSPPTSPGLAGPDDDDTSTSDDDEDLVVTMTTMFDRNLRRIQSQQDFRNDFRQYPGDRSYARRELRCHGGGGSGGGEIFRDPSLHRLSSPLQPLCQQPGGGCHITGGATTGCGLRGPLVATAGKNNRQPVVAAAVQRLRTRGPPWRRHTISGEELNFNNRSGTAAANQMTILNQNQVWSPRCGLSDDEEEEERMLTAKKLKILRGRDSPRSSACNNPMQRQQFFQQQPRRGTVVLRGDRSAANNEQLPRLRNDQQTISNNNKYAGISGGETFLFMSASAQMPDSSI